MSALSALQSYMLLDSDKPSALEIVRQTAKDLELNRTNLINVVASLGEYINDEALGIRSKAVQFLSGVIGEIPPPFLSRLQVNVLCQFYCDRIEDGGAVEGLKTLQGMTRFNEEMAATTFRAIIDHFGDLQTRPQTKRLQIVDLLHSLMSNHRQALKNMGDETIIGVTDVVSGEKDPRNLMIIFSILKVIMIEWDISNHAEVLFDSVFCYFPITFRPPPDDPYGITAQDLKSRLRECIAASAYFAPFAFPQLIDKLDSTSPNVKKDVLQTISSCAASYSVNQLSKYSVTLWDSLKYEILNVQEEDLAEEALTALQAIAAKLGYGLTSSEANSALARYLKPITKDCNEQLQQPQHKQAKPAGRILSSLSRASPIALFLVVRAVMPSLLTIYQAAESISKQRALLEVLVQIFDSAITIHGIKNISSLSTDIQNPLEEFKGEFFDLASKALMSTSTEELSFRIMAVKCLVRLCSLRNYLEESEAGMIVQYFDDIVLSEDLIGLEALRAEAIKALVEISGIKPDLVMNITVPAFMAKLPDSNVPLESNYLVILEGLAQLSVERGLAQTLIRRLLSKLDLVLQGEDSVAYPRAILSTLYYILSQGSLVGDPSLQFYYDKIVVGLISRVVSAATGRSATTALNEESNLETLGRLANLVIRALDQEKQQIVGRQIYSLFAEDGVFRRLPDRHDSPKAERKTMIISTWLMAGVGRKILLSDATGSRDLQILLRTLVELARAEDIAAIRNAILRQIGLLINKFFTTEQTPYATELLWDKDTLLLEALLLDESGSLIEATGGTENSIRSTFWISKSLVLRHAQTEKVLDRLLALLSIPNHGLHCARGFGLLLAPDEALSKENGAQIRLLAKQRVFNFCVPKIAKGFRAADTSLKSNYLIALSGILKYVPTDILMTEIETLLPLLLQSLDLNDQEVKAATIESIIVISQESPSAVEGHISSLINRLLKTAESRNTTTTTTADKQQQTQRQQGENIAKVRLNALRCLWIFPGRVKDSALLPFRNRVVRSLWEVLDDRKRDVRKAAVECRAAWLNLDEPDED